MLYAVVIPFVCKGERCYVRMLCSGNREGAEHYRDLIKAEGKTWICAISSVRVGKAHVYTMAQGMRQWYLDVTSPPLVSTPHGVVDVGTEFVVRTSDAELLTL